MRPSHAITLADIENVTVRKGIDLWQQMRGSNVMPSRAQMSPRQLSGILRNTVLVRALLNGEEFEMRIVGDAVVQAQGTSLQGMTMAEIDLVLPGHGSQLRKGYGWTYRKAAPGAYRGWYVREADGRSMYHESVVLPLGDDGRTVDHILVVGVYAMQPGETLR
ncbi:MAG TPA: PAS domain-containing protein [Rhizomicrobium sp.]